MTSNVGSTGPTATIRVAAAQINTTVGDIDGNARLIEEWIGLAQGQGADLVAFPEVTSTGYPPEDLVLYDNFIAANRAAVGRIATTVGDIVALVGFVELEDGKLYNAAAVLHKQKIIATYRKIHLPNYGVFDERRYFTAGNQCPVLSVRGIKIGINICEDIWEPVGPSEVQRAAGAQIVVNLNASPYESGKHGRGWISTELTTVKIATFAPMPSASVTAAIDVNPGRRARPRAAIRKSLNTFVIFSQPPIRIPRISVFRYRS